jgi:hypothetical protein
MCQTYITANKLKQTRGLNWTKIQYKVYLPIWKKIDVQDAEFSVFGPEFLAHTHIRLSYVVIIDTISATYSLAYTLMFVNFVS